MHGHYYVGAFVLSYKVNGIALLLYGLYHAPWRYTLNEFCYDFYNSFLFIFHTKETKSSMLGHSPAYLIGNTFPLISRVRGFLILILWVQFYIFLALNPLYYKVMHLYLLFIINLCSASKILDSVEPDNCMLHLTRPLLI